MAARATCYAASKQTRDSIPPLDPRIKIDKEEELMKNGNVVISKLTRDGRLCQEKDSPEAS